MNTRPPHQTREQFSDRHTLLPQIKMVGWSRFDKAAAHHLGGHLHANAWEICYLVAGHVDWWAGSQMYEIKKGQVFITRPNELHGGQDAIMHPCELYWLQVTLPQTPAPSNKPSASTAQTAKATKTKSTAKRTAKPAGLNHHDFACLQRLFPGTDELAVLFERLLAEHRSPDAHASLAAQATLNTLLIEVHRLGVRFDKHQHEQQNSRTSRIENVVQWIDNHLDEPLTINELAQHANLGISQFRARFTEEVGQSPNAYITNRRLKQAKHWLATKPDWPITRIAHALNFSTSQYFATVFKNHAGMTPGEYRTRYAVSSINKT